MRGFNIVDIDCEVYGPVDEKFYAEMLQEGMRLVNLFGDNGLVMLNRDLNRLNRRLIANRDTDIYEELAEQARALRNVIEDVMR